jgi:hypothetical protein
VRESRKQGEIKEIVPFFAIKIVYLTLYLPNHSSKCNNQPLSLSALCFEGFDFIEFELITDDSITPLSYLCAKIQMSNAYSTARTTCQGKLHSQLWNNTISY